MSEADWYGNWIWGCSIREIILTRGPRHIGTVGNQFGEVVPNGIYIYDFHAGPFRSTRKMAIVK